jgi:hypothetical protein
MSEFIAPAAKSVENKRSEGNATPATIEANEWAAQRNNMAIWRILL